MRVQAMVEKVRNGVTRQSLTAKPIFKKLQCVVPPKGNRSSHAAPHGYGAHRPPAKPQASGAKRRLPEQPERLPIAWVVQGIARVDAIQAALAIRAFPGSRFGAEIRMPFPSAFRRWFHASDNPARVARQLNDLQRAGLIGLSGMLGGFRVTPKRAS